MNNQTERRWSIPAELAALPQWVCTCWKEEKQGRNLARETEAAQ